MATARLVVSALIRRDGRILLVQEIGRGDGEASWMLTRGVVEHGELIDVEWVAEQNALHRPDRMSWYDAEPSRRHLAGEAAEVSVMDRR